MAFTKEQLAEALTQHHRGFTDNPGAYNNIEDVVSSEEYGEKLAEYLVSLMNEEVK